jgi:hypothetical protein
MIKSKIIKINDVDYNLNLGLKVQIEIGKQSKELFGQTLNYYGVELSIQNIFVYEYIAIKTCNTGFTMTYYEFLDYIDDKPVFMSVFTDLHFYNLNDEKLYSDLNKKNDKPEKKKKWQIFKKLKK